MADLRTDVEDRGARWQISLALGKDYVSGLGVVKKQMQIGSAVVKMGGIAGVWTDEKHRFQGYASQSMWESIGVMERKNCDISILFGIADFYHRFGYVPVFASQSMRIATAQLLTLGGRLESRAGRKTDFESMRRLYRRYNAGRSGMDARPKGWYPRWYMPRWIEGAMRREGKMVVVCDARDRVCGYAIFDARMERTLVTEVCGKDRKALASVGHAIARRAKRTGANEVGFQLPPDDPFVSTCMPLGCSISTSYPSNSGAMGRIICLDRLMKKMLPVFNARWKNSDVNWAGRFTIETDIGCIGLEISGSGIALVDGGRVAISMSQSVLTQLVMGYRSAVAVASDKGVKIPRRLLPVLDVLFPKGNPYMWWSDRF